VEVVSGVTDRDPVIASPLAAKKAIPDGGRVTVVPEKKEGS
jgi:hypothetical protein